MKQFSTPAIDEQGRILLPKELRTMLELVHGDKVAVCLTSDNTIILQPTAANTHRCDICDQMTSSITVTKVNVCDGCASVIAAK